MASPKQNENCKLYLLTPPTIEPVSFAETLQRAIDAAPEIVAAAQRLFDKGLIDQADGGYLTSLGLDAAEHVQNVLQILRG